MTRIPAALTALLLTVITGCAGARDTSRTTPAEASHVSARTAATTAPLRPVCYGGCDGATALGPTAMVRVAWQVATRDRVVATPIEFAAGVAVGSLDGSLYGVGDDGVQLFETATGAPIRASALASNGGVIAANEAGDVLLVQRSGDIQWRTSLRSPVVTAPVASVEGSLYVAANGIYRMDGAGNVLWHHVEATTVYQQPRRVPGGGISYTTVDGRDVTLDPDGEIISDTTRPPPDENAPTPPPIARVDRVGNRYFTDRDQGIVGEDRDGRRLFRYSLGAHVAGSVLLTSTGTLIVGADDGKLYALR